MSAPDSRQGTPSFVAFLNYLRQQPGFEHIGVDHYVRFQALLDKLGGGDAPTRRLYPDELRHLFCPIFATSKQQQEQFHRAVAAYYNLEAPPLLSGPITPVSAGDQVSHTTAGNSQGGLRPGATARLVERVKGSTALLGRVNRSTILFGGAAAVLSGLTVWVALLAGQAIQGVKSGANNNVEIGQKPTPVNPNNVNGGQGGGGGSAGQENQHVKNQNAPPSNSDANPGGTAINSNSMAEASTGVPGNANTQPLATPPVTPTQAPASRDSSLPFGVIGVLILGFAGYELYRYSRRQQILQRQLNKKPPLIWRVKTDAPPSPIWDPEKIKNALWRMRQRQVAEFGRLDVQATLTATVESLGYTTLRYCPATRVPEYVILIDRASFLDHQARLFSELTAALGRAELYVARFYFEHPLVCLDERGASWSLPDLQAHYEGNRLLIFGDGGPFLDPLSGELTQWSAQYQHWPERALLTPVPAGQWGRRERTLAELFVVLPATTGGLEALVDHLESAVKPPLASWQRLRDAVVPQRLEDPDALGRLRSYLGEKGFGWLCACAVYPELQWELTLRLGQLLSDGEQLLAEESLLRLIRLPWFRTGSIPDELRGSLIGQLGTEREREVRAAIIELMEKHRPESVKRKETVAQAAHAANLAAQRWLRYRDRASYREVMRNKTLTKVLASGPAPALSLPQNWAARLFKDSIPAFGLRTTVRLLLTLLLALVACAGLLLLAYLRSHQQEATNTNVNNLNANVQVTPPINSNTTTNFNETNANISNANVSANTSGNTNGRRRGNGNSNQVTFGNANGAGNNNTGPANANSGGLNRQASLTQTPAPQSAKKIDELTTIVPPLFGGTEASLDNFAISLQMDKTQAYLIVHDGQGVSADKAMQYASRAKSYLSNMRGIDPALIQTIYGGRQDRASVELSELPANAENFSPDGRFYFTTDGGAVRVYDAKSRNEVSRFNITNGRLTAVAFSPDSSKLAIGTPVRVFDIVSGRELFTAKDYGQIGTLVFDGTGQRLIAYMEKVIVTFDASTGKVLSQAPFNLTEQTPAQSRQQTGGAASGNSNAPRARNHRRSGKRKPGNMNTGGGGNMNSGNANR